MSEQLEMTLCQNCGQPIYRSPQTRPGGDGWIHLESNYPGCRAGSGGAEPPSRIQSDKVPDRVIDAPIPDEDIRGFLATLKDASPAVLKAIAVFHRKRAMVAEAKCARLEAEKQDARTVLERLRRQVSELDSKDDHVKWHSAICCVESLIDKEIAKPAAAKQGDAS